MGSENVGIMEFLLVKITETSCKKISTV